MYQEFDALIGDKTAIYISHRLASTRFCDRVAFFDEGELREYGTHDELMRLGGGYAHMFAVQARYYQDGERIAEEVEVYAHQGA
jgi:ATP-binding cassette subfamily C protein